MPSSSLSSQTQGTTPSPNVGRAKRVPSDKAASTKPENGGLPADRHRQKRKTGKGLRLQIVIDPIATPKLYLMVKKSSGRSRTQRFALLAEQALTWNLHKMTDARLVTASPTPVRLGGLGDEDVTPRSHDDHHGPDQPTSISAPKSLTIGLANSANMLEGLDFG